MQPNQQTPPPIPPDPSTLPAQPVRHAVIQPLSSEDEIRRAAASSGAPARPSEPSVNPASAYPSGAVEAETAEDVNTYGGGLVTEPIHHSDQTAFQYGKLQTPASDVAAAPKGKKTAIKAIAVILLIGVLGAAAWLFFFNRVSSADLVRESFDGSTYLRPKQWSQISPSDSTYGNMTEEEGESTRFISVSEFPLASSQIPTGTDESYDRYRKLILGQFTESALRVTMSVNAPVDCPAAKLELTEVEEDTVKSETTVGLIRVIASCKKDGNTITMKMRLVAGMNDERVRMVIVGGTAVDWITNAQSFQRMLDTVEEHKTT